jgi:hypothetical protein
MKETGVTAEHIRAAAVRWVGVGRLTESDVGSHLGKSGLGLPFRTVVDVRRRLQAKPEGTVPPVSEAGAVKRCLYLASGDRVC